MHTKHYLVKLKEEDNLEVPEVDGRIMLRWILNKQD
jgi:hypothetical protein